MRKATAWQIVPALVVAVLALVTLLPSRGAPAIAQQPPATPTPPVIGQIGTWMVADPAFAALPGASGYSGILDRAASQIEVPQNWNGELVMYAHGYRGEGPLLTVSAPRIREHLVTLGYAWAASSYQENGYDPDLGVTNTRDLRDYFIQHLGQPRRTYLYGQSMGGHIVVASLEQHPGVYDGALAECGVLMQEQEIDYLQAFSAVADLLSGANALPAENSAAFADALKTQIIPALGTPESFTARGQDFESVIKNLTGGARPFRHQGMVDFYTGAFGSITRQRPTSLAGLAATNDYFTFHQDPAVALMPDDELNARVLRVAADPAFRNADTNPGFTLPTGEITVPLLTYHTTGDNFVPILHEINYRRTVNAAKNGDLLVQRGVRAPDHCQFQTDDIVEGFDDLVRWVEHGVKPEGDDFLAPDLTDLGRRWTHTILPGDDAGY